MPAKPKPDAFDAYHWHEALDRTHVISDQLDRMLRDHPVVDRTPTLRRLATEAADVLGELSAAIARANPFNQD